MTRANVPAYFKWRAGRPRWEPGPSLRTLGVRGHDLKDQSGKWLPEADAIAAADTINKTLSKNPAGIIYGSTRPPRHSKFALPPKFRAPIKVIPDYCDLLTEIWSHNHVNGRRRALPARGSFVYIFVLERRWAKIGVSTNVRHRYQTLSAGLPVELQPILIAPGTRRHEHELHHAFAEFRVRGEWFRIAGKFGNWLTMADLVCSR